MYKFEEIGIKTKVKSLIKRIMNYTGISNKYFKIKKIKKIKR